MGCVSNAVFREPPPKSATLPGAHDAFANELRAKPGEWAIWKTYEGDGSWNRAGPAAQSVRTGRVRSFKPARTFEATARAEGGKVVIYVRYVGTEGEGQETPDMLIIHPTYRKTSTGDEGQGDGYTCLYCPAKLGTFAEAEAHLNSHDKPDITVTDETP